jgi:flagellar motor protein MotB
LRPRGANTRHRQAGAEQSSQGEDSSHTASGVSTAGSHTGGDDDQEPHSDDGSGEEGEPGDQGDGSEGGGHNPEATHTDGTGQDDDGYQSAASGNSSSSNASGAGREGEGQPIQQPPPLLALPPEQQEPQEQQEQQQPQQQQQQQQQQQEQQELMAEAAGELNAAAMAPLITLAKELYKQDKGQPAVEMTKQQAECHGRFLREITTMVCSEYPTAQARDVLTIVSKSFGLLRYGKASDWLDSALRVDGPITIASPAEIESSFLEAMGFYMTPDSALDLLKALPQRLGLSLVQVCEEYKRLLAVHLGVTKKDLTDAQLLAENNFKYLSNGLGPGVNHLVHNWRTTQTFHQIQEALGHGERRGDSAFTRITARRGSAANIDSPDEEESTPVLTGIINAMAQLTTQMATQAAAQGEQHQALLDAFKNGNGGRGAGGSSKPKEGKGHQSKTQWPQRLVSRAGAHGGSMP